MRERSIAIILKIRYGASVVFFICNVLYTTFMTFLHSKADIEIGYAGFIIFLYTVMMLCLLLKSEAILKSADPLNCTNQKKYIFIICMEALELITAYVMFSNIEEGNRVLGIIFYFLLVTILFGIIYRMHSEIYFKYLKLKKENRLKNIISEYKLKYEFDIEVDEYFKGFIYFMFYLISLAFLYRYTLHNWFITLMFIGVNVYILWKLHWKGIKRLIKLKQMYVCLISIISSLGIIFMKLIYDGYIYISIFQNRDEYEYLMVLILFYLPLVYYGKRVSDIYNSKNCKWIE